MSTVRAQTQLLKSKELVKDKIELIRTKAANCLLREEAKLKQIDKALEALSEGNE